MMRKPARLISHINLILLTFFLISIQWTVLKAQCAPEEYSLDCIRKIHSGFIYLKSYNIDSKINPAGKIEYTTVFGKDTHYILQICTRSSEGGGIVLTIYNARREIMATMATGNETEAELEFNCDQTGIYYLTFTSQDPEGSCGGCVLSFSK